MSSTLKLEQLARAALARDDMQRRALWMELLATTADPTAITQPADPDPRVQALAAAFAELLAEHLGKPAPAWTAAVGPVADLFLTTRSSEAALVRLREQSPLPLRQRNLFAPAKYCQLV